MERGARHVQRAGHLACFNATSKAVFGSHYIWGNPHFVDGYHLSSGSAALDVGLGAGVTADVDGDTRPYCTAPDFGADEAVGDFACQIVYLPAALRND